MFQKLLGRWHGAQHEEEHARNSKTHLRCSTHAMPKREGCIDCKGWSHLPIPTPADMPCFLQLNEILAAGADVSVKGIDGKTPMQLASKAEALDLLKQYAGKVAA